MITIRSQFNRSEKLPPRKHVIHKNFLREASVSVSLAEHEAGLREEARELFAWRKFHWPINKVNRIVLNIPHTPSYEARISREEKEENRELEVG